MFHSVSLPNQPTRARWLGVALILVKLGTASAAGSSTDCPGPDTSISLSPGFCATVFADNIGHARHIVVSPSGSVYVNTWSGAYFNSDPIPPGGFLVALRDTQSTGKADVVKRFGESKLEGAAGGTGIALYQNAIFAEVNDRIMRYALATDEIAPSDKGEVIVSGLPITGDHPMHPFIIDAKGNLFVDVGTASNACEEKNRVPNSPGLQPCTEKETRGGTWRYDANKTNQKFSAAERYASGIRNGEGFAIDSDGRLFVTQHGRDQLQEDWPQFYKGHSGSDLPAEEIVRLEQGHDYGWPECYFDGLQKKLVLAPEYGGDGGEKVGVCATRTPPVAFFPAHWAPNDLLIALNPALPAVYRDGAFVAFHGSWNRAPAPQEGYDVVFQPMKDGKAAGKFIVFADGFAGAIKEPGRAAFRPSGLAQGPDGAIYISDDLHGRIWRVTYHGAPNAALASAPTSPVHATASSTALPPEGIHPDAAADGVASLRPPPNATEAEVVLGSRIFHGQVSNGTCAGCHGSDGKGSPVGADLTAGTWLWSDGSLEGLTKTISEGVATPKTHLGAMPAMGGSPLSAAELKAVSAYVWAIGHNK
ncbi:MAG TPA: c-type cytochrome [Bradyrhizobium sp.]|nr:c-type cytochrome [Bradyrhizobium sp.]